MKKSNTKPTGAVESGGVSDCKKRALALVEFAFEKAPSGSYAMTDIAIAFSSMLATLPKEARKRLIATVTRMAGKMQ